MAARSGQIVFLRGSWGPLRIFRGDPPHGTTGKRMLPLLFREELREWVINGTGANHYVWIDIYEWLGTTLPKPPRLRDIVDMADALVEAFERGRLVAMQRDPPFPALLDEVAPRTVRDPSPPEWVPDDDVPEKVTHQFARVLLFDSSGRPIPSAMNPSDVAVDIRVSGGPAYSRLPLIDGAIELDGLPSDSPSACTAVFVIQDAAEIVPDDVEPDAPVSIPSPMLRGTLFGPTLLTRRQLAERQTVWMATTTAFQLRRREVSVVEFEQFPHNGALLWPGYLLESTEALRDEAPRIPGIDCLRTVRALAPSYLPNGILVTGHHPSVSQARADGVLALLIGDDAARSIWVAVANSHGRVEDQQAILKWVSTDFGWDCDPGPIDNVVGPLTQQAIRSFQQAYNADTSGGIFETPAPRDPLAVDGDVGSYTWGAFFDCIQRALRGIFGVDPTGAASFPSQGPLALGVGEHHLIAPFVDSDVRRANARAVEVLFFDADDLPKRVCSPDTSSPCTVASCELYDPREYRFNYAPVSASIAREDWDLELPPQKALTGAVAYEEPLHTGDRRAHPTSDGSGALLAFKVGGAGFPAFEEGPPKRPDVNLDHGFLDNHADRRDHEHPDLCFVDNSKRRAPTLDDRLSLAKWRVKLDLAMNAKKTPRALVPVLLMEKALYARRVQDGIDAYYHFQYAKGEPRVLPNFDSFLAGKTEGDVLGDSSGSTVLESAADDTRAAAIELDDMLFPDTAKAPLEHTFQIRSEAIRVGRRGDARYPYPDTENWQKALGGFTAWIAAVVDVRVDLVTRTRAFWINMTIFMEDTYNFDPGKKDMATGIPDAENGRFEITGLAHEYVHTGDAKWLVSFTVPFAPVENRRSQPANQVVVEPIRR